MSTYDITALGELLIDFTEAGASPNGMKLFERNPGGAVANVVYAAAKLGRKAAFLGKVGSDMHGVFLRETFDAAGIDTQGLVLADDVFTTLAFVALSADGERAFSFSRKPGADTRLKTEELNFEILRDTRVLCVGSLSLTDEPARSATFAAVLEARKNGAVIAYDPNHRASLWSDAETAKRYLRSMLRHVDVLKLSGEECALLTDEAEPERAALKLRKMGIPCIAVTLGAEGALVCAKGECVKVPTFPGRALDSTGAGDAFWGGFLHRLLEINKLPGELTAEDAVSCAVWGNATATLCVQKRGGIPAMPELEEVERLVVRGK